MNNVVSDEKLDNDHLPAGKDNIQRMYNFTTQLFTSSKQRTLHIIANHDWNGFPQDYFMEGKDVGDAIGRLTTKKNEFWGEFKFDKLNKAAVSGKVFKLLRNHARIQVEVQKDIAGFTYEGFKIFNAYDTGTVAPYDIQEGTFEYTFPRKPTHPTEAAGYQRIATLNYTQDPQDVFERFDRGESEKDKSLFLIVKGKYKPYNGIEKDAYYKLELKKFDKDTGISSRYDIIRNYFYKVRIAAVKNGGYTTEEEAVKNPPSNNIFASTELSDFPAVSDGQHQLSVSPISRIITKPETFTAEFSYTGKYENVQLYPNWDNSCEFLGEIQKSKINETTGKISVQVKRVPTDREKIFTINLIARPDLKSYASIISRQISLVLRKAYEFKAELKSMGNAANNEVDIAFDIPAEIPVGVYPFDILIQTQELTPIPPTDGTKPLLLTVKEGKVYYQYTVNKTTEIRRTLKFKRNLSNKTETIKLLSQPDMFAEQTLQLQAY